MNTGYKSDLLISLKPLMDFPDGSDGKESACNAGDWGSIPGLGRSSGERNGNPFQYSSLGNPMDRGDWRATVHGVAESRTHQRTHTCSLFISFFPFKAEALSSLNH